LEKNSECRLIIREGGFSRGDIYDAYLGEKLKGVSKRTKGNQQKGSDPFWQANHSPFLKSQRLQLLEGLILQVIDAIGTQLQQLEGKGNQLLMNHQR